MSKVLLAFLLVLNLGSCASMLSSLPNPLKDDKGLEVNTQLGKTNNQTKKKQLLEATVNSTDKSQTSNNAEDIKIINSNTEVYMVILLCLFAGMAIPTRGQHNQIKLLKENLKYERSNRRRDSKEQDKKTEHA